LAVEVAIAHGHAMQWQGIAAAGVTGWTAQQHGV